jgi:small subunit ribosomal protein S2
MPYVNYRWLGGMLTNFQTVHSRVAKLHELERMVSTGETEQMIKKEGLKVRRERDKLQRNLGGIRQLERLPDAVFVIDTKKEHIAVTEANRLGIPVVAVANLMSRIVADAVEEGRFLAQRKGVKTPDTNAAPPPPAPVDPQEQARRAEEQQRARNEAAAAQREREARLTATPTEGDAATSATPAADGEAAPVSTDAAPAEPTGPGEPATETTTDA